MGGRVSAFGTTTNLSNAHEERERLSMSKAIVLASGGMDSCVTTAIAKAKGHDIHLLIGRAHV